MAQLDKLETIKTSATNKPMLQKQIELNDASEEVDHFIMALIIK